MAWTTEQKQDILDQLVEWISEGGTLRQFAREQAMGYVTLYNWINADDAVRERIARAREAGYESIAEECLDIADDPDLEPSDKKVRIWTRTQLLAKWSRQRYGDHQHVTHAGDKDQPITIVTGVPQPQADDTDLSMFGI